MVVVVVVVLVLVVGVGSGGAGVGNWSQLLLYLVVLFSSFALLFIVKKMSVFRCMGP